MSTFVVPERSWQTYELTPGVVSHTPAFPGSLYRIVTPVGVVMVVTSSGSAGSCLRFSGSLRKASEPSRELNIRAIEMRNG